MHFGVNYHFIRTEKRNTILMTYLNSCVYFALLFFIRKWWKWDVICVRKAQSQQRCSDQTLINQASTDKMSQMLTF